MRYEISNFGSTTKHPTITSESIYGFFGDYRFLSNYHLCPVYFDGLKFSSSEAAYMSCKTFDREAKEQLQGMTPSEAKAFGKTLILRPDWEYYRVVAMYSVVLAKYSQNKKERDLLLNTGSKYLEETNDWGDHFWGKNIFGNGLNMLGYISMSVRDYLRGKE